jgi:methionyl-tRNA formyltransferase
MRTQVILLGKGSLAVRIAEAFHMSESHDLALVVPVVPEPPWTESLLGWCDRVGVSAVRSGRIEDIPGNARSGWRAELVFSVFYDKILPASFLGRCERALNLHNSPLPRYRGMAPINWALKNGEREHGVTIHEMTPGIDDGPIVAQVRYPVYPELDEVRDVYGRSLAYGWTLFEQTLPLLDWIEPQPQDHTLATHYRAVDSERLGDRASFTRAESLASA